MPFGLGDALLLAGLRASVAEIQHVVSVAKLKAEGATEPLTQSYSSCNLRQRPILRSDVPSGLVPAAMARPQRACPVTRAPTAW
ncbi:hypothetical protein F4859DRAFT_78314 [Xylaria cf. heliscus]|nr:hypothetical protein F4859DRAFT_78314 [Xylaria cf. heliscus]